MEQTVEVLAEIRRETDLAWLVDDGVVQVWLPKSQVDLEDFDENGQTLFRVPEWLAEAKELI